MQTLKYMISMLFKCKDGFVLREDKIHYIKANKDGYALVYMRYAQEQPYAITLEDYALLVTVLLKDYEYQKFYMTSNGDVFSLEDIMIMGFDNEQNYHYVYIFDCKEENSDIFFIINEKDYNNILEICKNL